MGTSKALQVLLGPSEDVARANRRKGILLGIAVLQSPFHFIHTHDSIGSAPVSETILLLSTRFLYPD